MRRLALFLFLVAACGDDGGNTPQPDGGPVGPGADADLGQPVTIIVRRDGVARPNVRVHFQNPDSTLITSTNTDSNGEASAVMPNGGFVTAIEPFKDSSGTIPPVNVHTFAAVKPGDELILEEESGGNAIELVITAPTDPTNGVTGYLYSTACDNTTDPSTSASLYLEDACQPTTDVVIASLNGANEIVNYLYAADQDVSSGTLDLSSMTYVAPTEKTYTYNNVPAGIDGVFIIQQLASAAGQVVQLMGGAAGMPATTTMKLPAFSGASEVVVGFIERTYGTHGLADFGPFNATYTTDVAARLLPEATSAPSYDVVNRRVTWTEATGGQTPDFVIADAYAFRETPLLAIQWALTAPYTAGMVQFPTLPVEGTDYNFQATDTTGVDQVVLGKISGGYDAVREVLQSIDGPQSFGFAGSGTLTFQELHEDQPLRGAHGLLGRFNPGSTGPRWKSVVRRAR